jgi:hypothetical protein
MNGMYKRNALPELKPVYNRCYGNWIGRESRYGRVILKCDITQVLKFFSRIKWLSFLLSAMFVLSVCSSVLLYYPVLFIRNILVSFPSLMIEVPV